MVQFSANDLEFDYLEASCSQQLSSGDLINIAVMMAKDTGLDMQSKKKKKCKKKNVEDTETIENSLSVNCDENNDNGSLPNSEDVQYVNQELKKRKLGPQKDEKTHSAKPKKRKKLNHDSVEQTSTNTELEEENHTESTTVSVVAHASVKADDAHRLLERMSQLLNQTTNEAEDYKKTLKNFDWQKVCFDQYKADDCKRFFINVIRQVRKYRTLTELVDEVKTIKKLRCRIPKSADPFLPKRPTTPLFLFYQKKRASFLKKNPGLKASELSKLMAKKFAKLSPHKKQKYLDAYELSNKLYQAEMEKYRAEHADLFSKKHTTKKQISVAEYYIQKKCAKKLAKLQSKEDKKKLIHKYHQRWKTMDTDAKVQFIKEAEEKCSLQPSGEDDEHADACVQHVVLSKLEEKLKAKADGVVSKPPRNGFTLFVAKFAKKPHSPGGHGYMKDVSMAWNNLSDKKKLHYNKKAEKAKNDYILEHGKMPDTEKAGVKKTLKAVLSQLPKKPANVCSLFAQTMLPTLSHLPLSRDRMAECSRRWSQLSNNEKDQWKAKLLNARQDYVQELELAKQNLTPEQLEQYEAHLMLKKNPKSKDNDENKPASEKKVSKTSKKKILFEGQPNKPLNAFQLFSQAKLPLLSHLPTRERLSECGKLWSQQMTDTEKDLWKTKAVKAQKKYVKEMEIFKQTLSEEQLIEFNALQKPQNNAKAKIKKSELDPIEVDGENSNADVYVIEPPLIEDSLKTSQDSQSERKQSKRLKASKILKTSTNPEESCTADTVTESDVVTKKRSSRRNR